MIIDGKKIADTILGICAEEIKTLPRAPVLGILLTEENPVVRKFITAKCTYAGRIGVSVELVSMKPLEGTEAALSHVLALSRECDGLIIQLPLARSLESETMFKLLPMERDVDVLGETASHLFSENRLPIMPPVIGAMKEVLATHAVSMRGKRVAIVGTGRLVGKPALVWVEREGGIPDILSKETENNETRLHEADIIILGAGAPGFLLPEHIKEGAVVLDAGTSEEGGKLMGDADPRCAEKASLFTPTPGGIGPITVAMIFKNLLRLMALRERRSS